MFVYVRMCVTGIGHGYGEAGVHLKTFGRRWRRRATYAVDSRAKGVRLVDMGTYLDSGRESTWT